MRRDRQEDRLCEWCLAQFSAARHHQLGTVQRFCRRACFNAAKRAWGVIRRAA